MIVDGKGNLFEDRRKNSNRRKSEYDEKGGRRGVERRKAPDQLTKKPRVIK